nr:sugar ABC transporter permease [Tuberibacillus sp. Marseille-P3662]
MKLERSYPVKVKQKTSLKQLFFSQKLAPYIFVLPFIIVFLVFFLYPIIDMISMSFHRVLPGVHDFIGLQNYNRITNQHFVHAIKNTIVYTIWTLIILIPIPLFLATVLNSKFLRFKNGFKAMLYMPSLTSVIVGGIIFSLMFSETDTALINSLLIKIGLKPQAWTMGATTGMFLMVALASWRWMGVNILYFLAGLQNIPNELYEAAEMDGANRFYKFFKITVPLLKPVTIFTLTISLFAGFRMFEESYVLWKGNSPNDIGLTIVGYIYQLAFSYNNMGAAAAVGVVLLIIVSVLCFVMLKFFGVFKED